jgi:hypothetical protein
MKSLLVVVMVLFALSAAETAGAEPWSPVQVALWHPAQIMPEDYSVYGLRVNLLYGKNEAVWGLDLGVANTSPGGVRGIQAGLINGPGHLAGVGVGGINSADRVDGLQAGLMSVSENEMNGAQVSAIFNVGKTVRGLQVGLVNSADELKGLQIGLINLVKNGPIPFFPLINPGF